MKLPASAWGKDWANENYGTKKKKFKVTIVKKCGEKVYIQYKNQTPKVVLREELEKWVNLEAESQKNTTDRKRKTPNGAPRSMETKR